MCNWTIFNNILNKFFFIYNILNMKNSHTFKVINNVYKICIN